jgi:hypothetical protein
MPQERRPLLACRTKGPSLAAAPAVRPRRHTRRVAITPLVLYGRLVTFDPERPVIDDGALYIGSDERIAAVQRRTAAAPSGFERAARLETGGCVYPGLIDLHNHVVYNVLSLWSPPGRTEPYSSRYQWPGDRSYEGLVSDPANALGALAGKAHLKYVEVKAVIGGVTAIQGSAKMAYPYEGWLVRNVEYETFKTGEKTVYQSALPLRTDADYAKQRERMEQGAAFITTSPRAPTRSWSPSTTSCATRTASGRASAASTAPRSSRPTTPSGRPGAAR